MFGLDEWFQNFSQFNLVGLKKETVATVKNPVAEYSIYWTFKGMQVSSFIGGLIVHPIYRIYKLMNIDEATRTTNTTKIIRNTSRRIQGRFILAGLAAGPLIGVFLPVVRGWSTERLKEECYKIRTSGDYLVWDRATICCGFFGWYWKRFQGAVDGVNLALAYALAYHYVLKHKTSVILKDKFKPEELYDSVVEAEAKQDSLREMFRSKNLFLEDMKKN
ncbi:unnamed protein product [Bursaphelenchus xylophilus]|uniref:(pine wood nematode) hypothetical protein n=1 Tax=Bursaphelenchus xylophilus TaxID=6326 RepID=A0A1I7RNZ4_BURXY|nr:unnamed protein product [Bursaphelenchus xylophilus]CAG9124406.1 unnamed protein product [Bursaphelenchus xylophilus]